MNEFGDLADLDMEKLIRISEQYTNRAEEMNERAAALTGEASSKDGRIKVSCSVSGGVTSLDLDPRALRMQAGELAETIRTLVNEANADLQRKLNELMTEAFGEEASPARLTASRDAMREQVEEAAAAYQRALGDAMGELDRMRKQLGL